MTTPDQKSRLTFTRTYTIFQFLPNPNATDWGLPDLRIGQEQQRGSDGTLVSLRSFGFYSSCWTQVTDAKALATRSKKLRLKISLGEREISSFSKRKNYFHLAGEEGSGSLSSASVMIGDKLIKHAIWSNSNHKPK